MSALTKKYYSISEVASMFDISASALRYIESREPNLKICKIKNRRYYSQCNIKQIRSIFIKPKGHQFQSNQHNYLLQINNLIDVFKNVQIDFNKFLADLKFIDV